MKKSGYLGETPVGSLYKCRYTGIVALEKHMKFVPSILPQCSTNEPMHESELAKLNRKSILVAFNQMDANCNTCKNFERLHSDNKKGSNPAGNFVYGNCKNINANFNFNPYYNNAKTRGFDIMLHVADFIGMPCWESR